MFFSAKEVGSLLASSYFCTRQLETEKIEPMKILIAYLPAHSDQACSSAFVPTTQADLFLIEDDS